jgi:hypothetical protein
MMPSNTKSDKVFALLEELMFTYHAVSEREAIDKKKLLSNLDQLSFFKEKGYVSELDDGRVFLTSQGMQALLAHFS